MQPCLLRMTVGRHRHPRTFARPRVHASSAAQIWAIAASALRAARVRVAPAAAARRRRPATVRASSRPPPSLSLADGPRWVASARRGCGQAKSRVRQQRTWLGLWHPVVVRTLRRRTRQPTERPHVVHKGVSGRLQHAPLAQRHRTLVFVHAPQPRPRRA